MNKRKADSKEINEPEYEERLMKAVKELKEVMHGVTGYAG